MTDFAKGMAQGLLSKIKDASSGKPMCFMEVCGTHTMSIFRSGIRKLLPREIRLVSGPGCPVCVTPVGEIDQMIELSLLPGVITATFGDILRVPGSTYNLSEARARGAEIKVVYSPADALEIAENNPDKKVVFLGIGFETTAPSVAATILQAHRNNLKNFMVFSSHKLMPPALDVLLSDPEIDMDGLICPGHVSTIIGARAFEPVAEKFQMPCVVTGFEPLDILQGICMLAQQVSRGENMVENAYRRAVSWDGNRRARKIIETVFKPADARWRGLGTIAGSGLEIRKEFRKFDARRHFGTREKTVPEPKGCQCAQIIKGMALPSSCPMFSRACTPLTPVGPCMVSSEGTCAAYYKYGES